MRRLILMTILAAAAVTDVSIPSVAAARESAQPFCIRGRGCVPATEASYNACFNLALRRGLNVSRGDRYNLDYFIYQCLAGTIPR